MQIHRIILIFCLVLLSCSGNYTPKPRGYYRIEFPEKEYRLFDSIYPYTFQHPVYSVVKPDLGKNVEPFWSNIMFPTLNAQIHLSYKNIENNLFEFEEDTRKMAFKHTIKAEVINTIVWENSDEKVYGILYEIKGNVASQLQFYLTDSTKHFIRGALYFNTHPNKDSLAPAVKFIRKDIDKFIETFKWKK